VKVAIRPEVRRSHQATFDLSGGPLTYSEAELAGITHEVLVIHGREDQVIPVEAAYYLAAGLPNAQLHILPHAGHRVQIEQADRFAALAGMFFGEKL
jgi:2-hydroxymuconate-semialdehyde hydrolase